MTPRPLYRWKSFLFGILVLGFLGWSWVASNYSGKGVSWVPPKRNQSVSVLQDASMIKITGLISPPKTTWGSAGFRFTTSRKATPGSKAGTSTSIVPSGKWWPAAVTRERKENGGWVFWNVWLAHWFVMLVFLMPWASLLGWRWRRQRALTNRS